MDTNVRHSLPVDDLSLMDLLRVLSKHRWMILCVTLLGGCIAIGAALILPKKYAATTVVSPVSNAPGSGAMSTLGSIASEFSGLASLTGISVAGDSRKAEYVAVLESDTLTSHFITKDRLLPILYRSLWDPRTSSWKVHNPTDTPTLWKAIQRFKKLRSISTNPRTGLVTLSITWTNPHLAADWANGLVEMTNDYLRRQAITESERNITFLNQQASKTDVVGVKQAIYSILQNEIAKEMLARGSDEYALKVIDPAIAPERPSSPSRLLWLALGLAAGAILSCIAALLAEQSVQAK